MKPIEFNKQAAQGDILLTKIDSLPDGLKAFGSEDGHYIVAHSETGHHHVLSIDDVDVFQAAIDDFVLYVVAKKDTVLRHMRSFDTHEPLKLDGGSIYRINRQREYISEGFRRAQD